MNNFEYHNPVKIIFGEKTITKISKEIPSNSRVLITYGGGSIKKNGIFTEVKNALSNHFFIEFGGIEPNPEYETLMQAAALVKKENIDFILAVGGGSVLDGTKFISAAATYQGDDPWDILSKGAAVKSAIPLASIMTLPATGSEMNSFAVVSRRALSLKLAFGSPLLYPKFSILDPNTMKSLPRRQKANGVVDAFIHVLEQYLTYPNEAEVQDRWAEGVLKTLIIYGPDYVHQEFNYQNSSNIMWAATCALNGMIGVGVPHDWATHAIGHEITALFELDHAQTLAIILPGMMNVMQKEKAEKLQRFAKEVFDIPASDYTLEKVIDSTESFFQSLGMKTKLSDYSIPQDKIQTIVDMLAKGKSIKLGERATLNDDNVSQILNGQFA
ncbi:MAG: iron-containing alcohol dehydrogenase [Bacteroidales bacterium]|nr:iron-containing alcohol dehydrogenase [Bacteroidales bacterium]